MEFTFGFITLIVTLSIIAIMMIAVWKATMDDIKRDEKLKNTVYARKVAERKFREMVEHTEYRIHRNPVRFINESDIDWGNDKEVLM